MIDQVDADRIVMPHGLRDSHLGSDGIGGGCEDELACRIGIVQSAERPVFRQHRFVVRLTHQTVNDALNASRRRQVNTSCRVLL